jgi:hypothetical protein
VMCRKGAVLRGGGLASLSPGEPGEAERARCEEDDAVELRGGATAAPHHHRRRPAG